MMCLTPSHLVFAATWGFAGLSHGCLTWLSHHRLTAHTWATRRYPLFVSAVSPCLTICLTSVSLSGGSIDPRQSETKDVGPEGAHPK